MAFSWSDEGQTVPGNPVAAPIPLPAGTREPLVKLTISFTEDGQPFISTSAPRAPRGPFVLADYREHEGQLLDEDQHALLCVELERRVRRFEELARQAGEELDAAREALEACQDAPTRPLAVDARRAAAKRPPAAP